MDKKLIRDSKQNLHLLENFTKKAIAVCNTAPFDVVVISEEKQVGERFSDRFTHALATVFDQGYGRVLAVGNDCPDLARKDLLEANKLLSSNQLVFGPDLRGGVYLLGIEKSAFRRGDLKRLPWQQADLLSKLIQYAKDRSFSAAFLETKADFNNSSDLSDHWFSSPGIRSLINAQINTITTFPEVDALYDHEVVGFFSYRGPPAIAA